MTGLLTGTNKFKNFEIETNLKVSVLNSPYLEGRRYVYGGGNVTPTPQVDNITITRNGTEITLVPGVEFKAQDAHSRPRLAVTDAENNFYFITKVDEAPFSSSVSYRFTLDENITWVTPGGGTLSTDGTIDIIDAFGKSPEVLQPELISWLEAQGFTIPIE